MTGSKIAVKKLIDEINKMKEQMSAEDLEKLQKQMEQKNTENKRRFATRSRMIYESHSF